MYALYKYVIPRAKICLNERPKEEMKSATLISQNIVAWDAMSGMISEIIRMSSIPSIYPNTMPEHNKTTIKCTNSTFSFLSEFPTLTFLLWVAHAVCFFLKSFLNYYCEEKKITPNTYGFALSHCGNERPADIPSWSVIVIFCVYY